MLFNFQMNFNSSAAEAEEAAAVGHGLLLRALLLVCKGGGLLLAYFDRHAERFALTIDAQGELISRRVLGNNGAQVALAAYRLAVYLGDDIICLDACLFRGAALRDGHDSRALGQAVFGRFLAHIADHDADIGLGDVALFDDAVNYRAHGVNGDGKADVINGRARAGRAGILGVRDADDLAVEVKQCTARVAGVNGAVGLNEVHGDVAGERYLAVECAHGAGGQREGQLAKRIADGDDIVADIEVIRVAERDGSEPLGVNFEYGDVVALVIAYERRVIALAVIKRRLNGACRLYNVIVCQKIAIGGEDKSRARGSRLRGVAPEVRRDLRGDADGGVYVCRIDLGGGHLLARVYLRGVHDRRRALALVDRRAAAGRKHGVADRRAAKAREHRRNEKAGDDGAFLLPERRLFLLGRLSLALLIGVGGGEAVLALDYRVVIADVVIIVHIIHIVEPPIDFLFGMTKA